MSLLTRLRATEAQKTQDAAGIQDVEASENLDPRAKMMRDIQAMFEGYATCSVDGSGAPADDGQDNLSLKLKRKQPARDPPRAPLTSSRCLAYLLYETNPG